MASRPVIALLTTITLVMAAYGAAHAASGQAQTAAAAANASGAVAWSDLSRQQREALAPLADDWAQLSPFRQRKWADIALRLPSMPAEQQGRVRERMAEWARMSTAERNQARLNFQQAQDVSAQDKQARWEAYQALPAQQRQALAAQAQAPAASASAPVRAAKPALRSAPLDAQTPKSNVVKAPPETAIRVSPVGPAVVKGNVGASTNLLTSTPRPPTHQAAGQPKIVASSDEVDRATLLPKRTVKSEARAAPAAAPSTAPASAPAAP